MFHTSDEKTMDAKRIESLRIQRKRRNDHVFSLKYFPSFVEKKNIRNIFSDFGNVRRPKSKKYSHQNNQQLANCKKNGAKKVDSNY